MWGKETFVGPEPGGKNGRFQMFKRMRQFVLDLVIVLAVIYGLSYLGVIQVKVNVDAERASEVAQQVEDMAVDAYNDVTGAVVEEVK